MPRRKRSKNPLAEIDRFAVYPAIGIARVGNAPEQYFLAPEAPGVLPDPTAPVPGRQPHWTAGYKDADGRIKRQACRFRIFGLDRGGRPVKEITAADAEITWEVHLAARKAAWYQFQNAMDLGAHAKEALMRNASYPREKLAVTPRAKRIAGRSINTDGKTAKYSISGTIADKYKVTLGQLRTDAQGRLLVLGGDGEAHSFAGQRTPITTFANNEGWYDDIADGPVRAHIKLKGHSKPVTAEPAVVAMTPPNYGPGLRGVVTMYDVVLDLFYREAIGDHEPLHRPERPSFTRHIYPILERLVQTQWVNQGFFQVFGEGAAGEFTTPERIARLATPGRDKKQQRAHRRARMAVFAWFRDPRSDDPEPALIPPFYGDSFGDFTGLANEQLAVTETQYRWLESWTNGDFVADWPGKPPPPVPLDMLSVANQPHALTRAHLEDILGGPFHPGIELTWTLRRASMWQAPFRLRLLPRGQQPADDYGPILRPDSCLGPDGPLQASGPGSLTRWMGVPWQTDSASCLSGYDASYYLPLPSFWAARIPDEVLSRFGYERARDRKLTPRLRARHFDYRSYWLRDLNPTGNARRSDMVADWWKLGVVAPMTGPSDGSKVGLPGTMWVETGRSASFTRSDPTRVMIMRAENQIGPALDGRGSPRCDEPLPKAEPPAGEDAREVHIAHRRRRYDRGNR